MLCQYCKQRKATVHVKENVNGYSTERYFCDHCAEEMNQGNSPFSFSVHDLLSDYLEHEMPPDTQGKAFGEKTCPHCGQTYQHYKKIGLFGCAECYQVFRPMILPLIRRIQGSNQHAGKVPEKMERIQRFQKQAQHLQSILKEAIAKEEYEKAAGIRDQIKSFEEKVVHLKEDAK